MLLFRRGPRRKGGIRDPAAVPWLSLLLLLLLLLLPPLTLLLSLNVLRVLLLPLLPLLALLLQPLPHSRIAGGVFVRPGEWRPRVRRRLLPDESQSERSGVEWSVVHASYVCVFARSRACEGTGPESWVTRKIAQD